MQREFKKACHILILTATDPKTANPPLFANFKQPNTKAVFVAKSIATIQLIASLNLRYLKFFHKSSPVDSE